MKEVMSLEDALNEKIPSAFAGNMSRELNMEDDFGFEDEEYPRHGAKLKQRSYPHLTHGTFGESKIDKIISKYFNINEEDELRKESNKKRLREMKEFDKSEVKRLSETIRQERSALSFMEKNPNSSLVGITNKKNLIFKDGITETKITPNGSIL
jgi:vacuolar-type H+-ATPase subunit I/STV1